MKKSISSIAINIMFYIILGIGLTSSIIFIRAVYYVNINKPAYANDYTFIMPYTEARQMVFVGIWAIISFFALLFISKKWNIDSIISHNIFNNARTYKSKHASVRRK